VKHVFHRIEGYCCPDLRAMYSWVVKKFPNGSRFVEVGALLGQSTAFLVVEMINKNKEMKINVVDTWKGTEPWTDIGEKISEHQNFIKKYGKDLYPKFEENMKKFGLFNYIWPIQMKSEEAVEMFRDKTLDFVFIDADHSYNAVRLDIDVWLPKVKVGGILAGHDYSLSADWSRKGVIKAVTETFGENCERIGSVWWHQNV